MDDLESTTAESRPWTLPAVIQNRRAPPAFEASGSGLRRVGPPTTDHPRFLRAIDASRSVSGRTSRSAGGPISVGAPARADWLDRPDEPRTDRLDWTNWVHRLVGPTYLGRPVATTEADDMCQWLSFVGLWERSTAVRGTSTMRDGRCHPRQRAATQRHPGRKRRRSRVGARGPTADGTVAPEDTLR